MANFSLEDLATSAGSNTGDFLKDSANQAANFACGIYQKYPRWTIDPLYGATGFATPIAQFKKGLWDKLCSPSGRPGLPPPPPEAPFKGGQCDAVRYVVNMRMYAGTYAGGYNDTLFVAYGPIASVELVPYEENGIKVFNVMCNCRGVSTRGQDLSPQGNYLASGYGDSVRSTYKSWSVINIYRLDEQPDNCGNLPGGDYPKTTPQPQELTQNITINQNNQNITFPITFNSNPTINIPISIKSTDPQTNQSFTINFNFDGVHFDFGGGNQGEGQNTNPDSDNINDIKDTTDQTNDKVTETSNDVKNIAEALDLKLVGVINAQPCGKSVVEYKYEGKTFVGLQAQINSLANMLARVHEDICLISAKTTGTDSALLEQLYDNVTTIGNNLSNLDKFLHSIGLDTLNNRIITIVQIVSTLSNDSSNLELLEQLYDNVTNLNAFLRTIGLESLHNRIVSLLQIVSSGSGISEVSNDALEEVLRRLGVNDFPITVPASIIDITDELGIPLPIKSETIESIPQFLVWLFKRMDEVLGQWSIPIEIKDTDPTTPGDQSKLTSIPAVNGRGFLKQTQLNWFKGG